MYLLPAATLPAAQRLALWRGRGRSGFRPLGLCVSYSAVSWRFQRHSVVCREKPQTVGVTDNPRPRPLGREQPIGIGTGGNDPGPGGHPGGPMGRRRGPVSWGGTRREVLRFRLPCGTPLARHAPPSPTEDGRVCGPGGCAEGQGLNSTLTTELSSGGRAALVRSMAIGLLKRAHSTPSRGSHSPGAHAGASASAKAARHPSTQL